MNEHSLLFRRLADAMDRRYKPRIEALQRRIDDLERASEQLANLAPRRIKSVRPGNRTWTYDARGAHPNDLPNAILLRILRGTLGLSIGEASDVYGVSGQQISEWETGERIVSDATVDVLRSLAKSMGLPLLDVPSPQLLLQLTLGVSGLDHDEFVAASGLHDAAERWAQGDGTATEDELRTLFSYITVPVRLDARNSSDPRRWAWHFGGEPVRVIDPMTDLPPLLDMLRELRQELGTYQAMARYIGLPSRKTVGHWFAGRHEPKPEHRALIEMAYRRMTTFSKEATR